MGYIVIGMFNGHPEFVSEDLTLTSVEGAAALYVVPADTRLDKDVEPVEGSEMIVEPQRLDSNPFDALGTDVAWDCIRARRDALLSACDWTLMPDSPLNDATKTAWTSYRQALRDIPGDCESPFTVTWPVKPE